MLDWAASPWLHVGVMGLLTLCTPLSPFLSDGADLERSELCRMGHGLTCKHVWRRVIISADHVKNWTEVAQESLERIYRELLIMFCVEKEGLVGRKEGPGWSRNLRVSSRISNKRDWKGTGFSGYWGPLWERSGETRIFFIDRYQKTNTF